ncbi:S41 family peptidase [Clostridium niameyense]|uniref:S41 family peptidase n=1 Tax=Clostridium niameyense TaxID=1622073 RepID=A0A6M0R8Z3_9CLOT|nr:S41 family peptidase [Clostridium niameyense]NEZ46722.1 S41 family peptidase [Clostridium niameyense]
MKEKKKWIWWTVVVLIVTNICTFLLSNFIPLYLPKGKVIIGAKQYEDIVKYQRVFLIRNQIYKYYDGKINENDMVEGAVKGMTAALKDPYTVFMSAKEYKEFNDQTEGNYSGVGIQLQAKEDKIMVVSVFDGSPAKEAGILPKDEIQKVNGTSVSGKEIDKAITLMKGKEATDVNLQLFRKDKGQYTVKLKRKKINIPTVKEEMIGNNIGYIQVSMFDEKTSDNFKAALDTLKSKGMKSLIIDLRGNPGGVLNECIKMASNFIPKGKVVVSTVDKYGNKKEYKSKGGNYGEIPLTVLVDGGSASASEVFLGAIKDYNLATAVGEKTFGKGVVQTLLETGDGTALKVTISKYYTPKGVNIHHIGIKPDVDIKYPDELRKKPYDRKLDPQFKKALEMAEDKIK